MKRQAQENGRRDTRVRMWVWPTHIRRFLYNILYRGDQWLILFMFYLYFVYLFYCYVCRNKWLRKSFCNSVFVNYLEHSLVSSQALSLLGKKKGKYAQYIFSFLWVMSGIFTQRHLCSKQKSYMLTLLNKVNLYIYIYIYMCVCVCVCVFLPACLSVCLYIYIYKARESERKKEREREGEREKEWSCGIEVKFICKSIYSDNIYYIVWVCRIKSYYKLFESKSCVFSSLGLRKENKNYAWIAKFKMFLYYCLETGVKKVYDFVNR